MANVFFPGDAPIRVHQNRVAHCPREFQAGYFWHSGKRKGTGKPPKWVEKLLQEPLSEEGLELQEEDIESDSEATREIDASQVEPADGDALVEPEPVGVIKQGTLEVTSTPRDKGTRYTLRRTIKLPRRYSRRMLGLSFHKGGGDVTIVTLANNYLL